MSKILRSARARPNRHTRTRARARQDLSLFSSLYLGALHSQDPAGSGTHAPHGQNGAFSGIADRSMPPPRALALPSVLADFLRLLAALAGAASSVSSLLSLLLSSELPLSPLALELSSSSLKSSEEEDILVLQRECACAVGPANSTNAAGRLDHSSAEVY